MLRHRLSSGILRAQSISHTTSHPPPLPIRLSSSISTSSSSNNSTSTTKSITSPSSNSTGGKLNGTTMTTPKTKSNTQRGLASAVLLSSENHKVGRGKWGLETVKGLREALSQRGLTTTGNKSTLIQRLESYESSPTPPSTRSHNRRISSSIITSSPSKGKVTISTTTSSTDPSSLPTTPPPIPTPPPSDSTLVPSDHKLSDNKSIPGLSDEDVEKLAEPDISVAPGLPKSAAGKTDTKGGKVASVKLPTYEPKGEPLAIPPFTPDNFSSRAEDSMSPPLNLPTSDSTNPKVMTISSTSTHIDAGPSHSLFETHDHDSSAPNADDVKAALKKTSEKLPSLMDVVNNVSFPSVQNITGINISEVIKMPQVGEKETRFEPIERRLNDEEKWGAWVLAGIVGVGLAIGGPGKSEKEKEEARKRKEEKKKLKEDKEKK